MKKKTVKKENLIFRVEKKTKTSLENLSKESKRSMSDYLRLLIEYAEQNKIKL